MDDHDALVRDDIFTDVFAVSVFSHFNDNHHLSKMANDFNIAQSNNIVGQKQNGIVTELERSKLIFYLDCAKDCDARSRQSADHKVKRVTKGGPEARANAIPKSINESITTRLAPNLFVASRIANIVSATKDHLEPEVPSLKQAALIRRHLARRRPLAIAYFKRLTAEFATEPTIPATLRKEVSV